MEKKIIIIEGPDNCGKDTLISKILEKFKLSTIIHCSKPVSNNPSLEQDTLFNNYVRQIKNYNTDLVLFNRGFHGEYVYGTLYRGRTKDEVIDMINYCESYLLDNYKNIYYIQLINESFDTLVNNEDGLSLSKGKIDLIKNETNLFIEIFNNSKLNKKLIYVNNIEKTGFRSKESIVEDVYKFIEI